LVKLSVVGASGALLHASIVKVVAADRGPSTEPEIAETRTEYVDAGSANGDMTVVNAGIVTGVPGNAPAGVSR
jgi:hypothetical protein